MVRPHHILRKNHLVLLFLVLEKTRNSELHYDNYHIQRKKRKYFAKRLYFFKLAVENWEI